MWMNLQSSMLHPCTVICFTYKLSSDLRNNLSSSLNSIFLSLEVSESRSLSCTSSPSRPRAVVLLLPCYSCMVSFALSPCYDCNHATLAMVLPCYSCYGFFRPFTMLCLLPCYSCNGFFRPFAMLCLLPCDSCYGFFRPFAMLCLLWIPLCFDYRTRLS